ncbi:hemerythrin family protein [Arcobacter lacus]|uniref:hemerythrin family protein n=1 Tax=Arcobacter lacus TaxID=1912876 RepID=UPI0021BB0081|nr:hemerythrin family protein [Arcobacter lacus]MCT7910171.1 hemerythrin family protein [Arcobacter lacus]
MLIDKETLPLVDMDFMNETHFEDVDLINELYENIVTYEKDSSNESFGILKSQYKKWQDHTINHFKTEEDEMQKKGFFAYPFHKGEHDSNLYQINIVWKNFETKRDIKELKDYIEKDLVDWLISHILSMDTVTARFFKTGMSPCAMH